MSKKFDLQVQFSDLCAFAPVGKKKCCVLFPNVRRPVAASDGKPHPVHYPAVVIPPSCLEVESRPTRMFHIQGDALRRKKGKEEEWERDNIDQVVWFIHGAELAIETNRESKYFKNKVKKKKVANFTKIFDDHKRHCHLDPLFVKHLDCIRLEDEQVLTRFLTVLNLRVKLDDGTLKLCNMIQKKFIFKGPNPGTKSRFRPKQLAEGFLLTIKGITSAALKARSFKCKQEGDFPEDAWNESVTLRPPKCGPLKIDIMNLTPEIYLGLKFDNQYFYDREKDRGRHFELLYPLCASRPDRLNKRIPQLPPEEPATIVDWPRCIPAYFESVQ